MMQVRLKPGLKLTTFEQSNTEPLRSLVFNKSIFKVFLLVIMATGIVHGMENIEQFRKGTICTKGSFLLSSVNFQQVVYEVMLFKVNC